MNCFNQCNNTCFSQNFYRFNGCNNHPQPCWFLECESLSSDCRCGEIINNNPIVVTNAVSTSLPTLQTVTSPNLFDLGSLTSTSGSAITYNPTADQFTVATAGTYRITYSFDYLSATTGVFGVQLSSLPVSKSQINATASVGGSVTKTTDVVLAAGTSFGLQLLSPDGTITLNTIQASNLNVSVRKIL